MGHIIPKDYTIYQQEPSLVDASIIRQYAEFAGENPQEIVEKIHNFKNLTRPEYHNLKDDFYGNSRFYIYDILGGNPGIELRANAINKFIPNGVKFIKEHPGTSFADFGGGVGAVCEMVHTMCDKKVTYIDLDSYMTKFALWRFEKNGFDINHIIIPEDDFSLPQMYDIIYTDAVWEHLDPEKQIDYCYKLSSYINSGGALIMIIDLSGEHPDMPMHYNVDIREVHKALLNSGLRVIYGLNNFASVWLK